MRGHPKVAAAGSTKMQEAQRSRSIRIRTVAIMLLSVVLVLV